MFINPENSSIGKVESRSASSGMMAADLPPPSSSVHGLSFSAAILLISADGRRPSEGELVQLGVVGQRTTGSGPPGTTDSTPRQAGLGANFSAIRLVDSGGLGWAAFLEHDGAAGERARAQLAGRQ